MRPRTDRHTDRHTDRQTDKPVGFYGPIAPPVLNAPSSECPQFRMPPSFDRSTTPRCLFNYNIPASVVLQCHCRNRHRGKFQYVSPPSVLLESSRYFLQHTGDTDAKNDGPEFWNSNSVIFENFLKFSKRRRAVPLRPIWTIMVAAKLDQSRVLVTKFRQNRLTLKGRSAGQRHIDRQTNSADNNGPSGLQSGQQRVKTIHFASSTTHAKCHKNRNSSCNNHKQ